MFIVEILKSALENGLIWCLLALGVYISYRVLDVADLTVEGTFPFGACLAALLIFVGISPIVATVLAVIGGVLAGIITGLLHTKLKIPAILAGIISMTGLYSINLFVLGLSNGFGKTLANLTFKKTIFSGFTSFLNNLTSNTNTIFWNYFGRVSIIIIIILAVFFLLYWFFGTEIGMGVRATGINQKMARAQGINTGKMIILGLAIANGLVALGGALFAQKMSSANVEMGRGSIVIGLASIIIGEVLFGKRDFLRSTISVIIGSICYQLLKMIAIELEVLDFLNLVIAIIITFILALPLLKTYLLSKKEKKVA